MLPTQKRLVALIFDATQVDPVTNQGASFKAFDEKRCVREVVEPARKVFEAGILFRVIFLVQCQEGEKGVNGAEAHYMYSPPGNDSPWSEGTPTSRFLLAAMHKFRADGVSRYRDDPGFGYINVNRVGWNEDSIVSAVRSSALYHKPDVQIVSLILHGRRPFPTVKEIEDLIENLEKAARRLAEVAA